MTKFWLLLLVCAPALASELPPDVVLTRDVSYGADRRQTFDVYAPRGARAVPVVFMVHGGAWSLGDKTNANTVHHKAAHWVSRGIVFISANYRMLPAADPREQARDVARALMAVQAHAGEWGADPARIVTMGHSAGAHLVALLATDARLRGMVRPWLGTVSLDTASLDVVATMRDWHYRLYDRAFGQNKDFWREVSPTAQLTRGTAPFLLVCSSRRSDSCPQGEAFATRVRAFGGRAETLMRDYSHAEINDELGHDPAYTALVDGFLASLDDGFAQRLRPAASR